MQKIDLKMLSDVPNGEGKAPSIRPASATKVLHRVGLSPALSHILQELRRELSTIASYQEDLSIPHDELVTLIHRVSSALGFELNAFEKDEVLAQIERERKPFGVLQPLVDDLDVSDIIVSDYSKITVQQGRKNFTTDLSFPDQGSYESFVERLLQRAGSAYSTKKPIADGMIGAYARVHAVHRCLCETGPYLTVRLNRFSSVTAQDLIAKGAAPRVVFDYLSAVIRSGHTVLVVGEVGTGKTTLVRALAATMPAEDSILVIEDTPEIRLEHPQVRYLATRESNTDGAGRVSPSECIRGGMRMAMNRIIFGEMRDAEAAEAFIDVCASGHPGLSTIHAKSAAEAITRLELFLGRAQKGVARAIVSDQIATAVQVIVFVNICSETGKRRIIQVKEIGPVADGVLRHRDMFTYQVSNGIAGWKLSTRVSAHRREIEEQGVYLGALPSVVEQEQNAQFREAASFSPRSSLKKSFQNSTGRTGNSSV